LKSIFSKKFFNSKFKKLKKYFELVGLDSDPDELNWIRIHVQVNQGLQFFKRQNIRINIHVVIWQLHPKNNMIPTCEYSPSQSVSTGGLAGGSSPGRRSLAIIRLQDAERENGEC
jgi:hypothetical protein